MKKILLSALVVVSIISCKKEVINVDKIQTPELDPSFALTLGKVSLNLGDIEQKYDQDELFYNNGKELFEFIYTSGVFEFYPANFLNFPQQNIADQFQLPAGAQAAFTLALPGDQVSFSDTNVASLSFSNGEQIDSVAVSNGNMFLSVSSDFAHDVTIVLKAPYLKNNGIPFQTTINLVYGGTTPVTSMNNIDLNGYVFDLTRGGQTTNEIEFITDITLTHSGQPVTGTEQFDFVYTIDINEFQNAWGYFGQYTNVIDQDTQAISLFSDLASGVVHFADPSITMKVYNTTGIEVDANFNAIYDPQNSSTTIIGGSGINGIPNIPAAAFVGDTGFLVHTIDNTNTSPTLSNLLDGGPSNIIYSAAATTNPNGVTQNFMSNTSKLWATADVALPFYGYAYNFSLVDTLDLVIEDALGLDTSSNLNHNDIEKLTVRIIADNGLPLNVGLQIYFADSNNVLIDSLFQAGDENLLVSGYVDFSLPVTHPNHGKVLSKTKKITDIVLSTAMLNKLINNNSSKLIYRGTANTNGANNSEDIKMYPEYTLDIKASAKVDFKINLSE